MKNFLKKVRLDKQILWIAVIALLFFLVMSFNNKVSELLQLNADRDAIATQTGNLQATEYTLRTQIAYATSDLAVEKWARTEGRMIREGDVPIVPVVPAQDTPEPTATPQATIEPVQNWQIWQALFFGH